MKKKKEGVVAVLVLLLAFGGILGGCKKKNGDREDMTRVSVILPHDDDGYWMLIAGEINQADDELKKSNGIDINMIRPQLNYNVPQMVDLLKQQIAAKVDVLVVQGNEDEDYIRTLTEAWKQGIKIICVDTDIKSLPEHLYIGTDNYKAGQMLGEELIHITGGVAKVSVISGEPGFSNLEERLEGLRDAVKDYPDIHLGEVQYDNYDGLTVMKLYYQNKDDADTVVFLEGTGGMTLSSQFSQKDDLYEHILGFDAFPGAIRGVVDGVIKQDTRMMGKKVIQEIANYIQTGKYSSDVVYTDINWLTAKNYKSLLSEEELEYVRKRNGGGTTP